VQNSRPRLKLARGRFYRGRDKQPTGAPAIFNRFALRHLPRLVFERAVRTSVASIDIRDELWRQFRKREARDVIVRMCAGYEGTLPRLAALYPDIATPLHIVWGERDKHFPVAQADALHRAVAGSTLRIIEGARHWMVWDRAEDVAREITAVKR